MRRLLLTIMLCAALPPASAYASVTSKLGPKIALPAAPPPPAVIPPPDLAPPHPSAPPPLPAMHDDAPGAVSRTDDGLRLTFGAGRADFTRASGAAIVDLAHGGLTDPAVVYNLYAHAAGTPEDISSPRRLSLERGLAVRSALIHGGIASIRIYVHAMGSASSPPGAPPDRVDITLARLDTTPPPCAPRPPAP